MAKELIMVMGVQRSGTTALFNSLARDKSLTAFHDSIDSAVYYKYRLRPLAEFVHVLNAAPRALLLKPLSETGHRTLESVFEEFEDYALRVVWIYRDPVNVLFSMHREGWLPRSQIESALHIPGWEKRNRRALQFHQQHPAQIAIVRYEDCFVDPSVFRRLSAWLGVKGKSLFRKDSSQGRKNISIAAQQKIDTAAAQTLEALNAARTFKPRALYRLRHDAAEALSKLRANRSPGIGNHTGGREPFDWRKVDLSCPAVAPSAVDTLHFWLDPSAKEAGSGDRVSALHDSGPYRMGATNVVNGPFHIPCVNGKHALLFPTEEIAERRATTSGILRFGLGHDWKFLFDGRSFSVFALFKPNVPNYAPYNQQRAVLLRVGQNHRRAPAFILEWDDNSNASKGIIIPDSSSPESSDEDAEISVITRPGSHFHKEWRIIHVQHVASSGGVLSISANGIPGTSMPGFRMQEQAPDTPIECELRLGGNERESESLFYGEVADVIIFNRAIDSGEQLGIIRYLKEKYEL